MVRIWNGSRNHHHGDKQALLVRMLMEHRLQIVAICSLQQIRGLSPFPCMILPDLVTIWP
jgi:hypothetical protein